MTTEKTRNVYALFIQTRPLRIPIKMVNNLNRERMNTVPNYCENVLTVRIGIQTKRALQSVTVDVDIETNNKRINIL